MTHKYEFGSDVVLACTSEVRSFSDIAAPHAPHAPWEFGWKGLGGVMGNLLHAPLVPRAPRDPPPRSAVVLPLCLARYLPRTMIKHKVTKTTTATTPPIKAWSVPCCPTALGSEGGADGETKKADEGVARRGEERKVRAGGCTRQNRVKKSWMISRSLPL